MEDEKTYIDKEIISINKDGTPNYAVFKYYVDSKTRVINAIERLK